MSFLLLLDAEKPNCLEDILPILPKYEKMVHDAEPLFELVGRRLEEIMRTLPHNQARYDKAYREMKALEDWLNTVRDKKIAKVWKKFTEGYPKALGPKDIQAYVNGEKDVMEINQIIIEVVLVKNQLEAIVEAFKQMGWMVGNVTKLRVAELNEVIL